MINDKNMLKKLVTSILNEDYVNAKPQLENAVESTVVAHFKNILVNKESK